MINSFSVRLFGICDKPGFMVLVAVVRFQKRANL